MYERIKSFCVDTGISIAQFERICGFSNGYISKVKEKERWSIMGFGSRL